MRLCVVTRAPTADGRRSEDETTAAEPSVASPGSLRADAGRLRAVQGRGILATMGKWWQLSGFHFKARGRANFEAKRPGSGPPRGAAGAVEWTLHGRTHRGSLSGDAVSHGYGLATASGERAWLCPQLPPLPKWLLPPPARGHPVSSRGRIERHGAYKQPRMVGAAGNCAGSQYAARRANLRCNNLFGAVALTAPRGLEITSARDSGVGDSPVWVKVQSGDLDKLKLLRTITPWSNG